MSNASPTTSVQITAPNGLNDKSREGDDRAKRAGTALIARIGRAASQLRTTTDVSASAHFSSSTTCRARQGGALVASSGRLRATSSSAGGSRPQATDLSNHHPRAEHEVEVEWTRTPATTATAVRRMLESGSNRLAGHRAVRYHPGGIVVADLADDGIEDRHLPTQPCARQIILRPFGALPASSEHTTSAPVFWRAAWEPATGRPMPFSPIASLAAWRQSTTASATPRSRSPPRRSHGHADAPRSRSLRLTWSTAKMNSLRMR